MARNLAAWNDEEIKTLIKRYKERGLTSGGLYTLAELQLELARRVKAPHDPKDFAACILILAAQSPNRRVTFGALFEYYNGRPPRGHGDIKTITASLERLGAYCHDRGLPIISTLVVNQATGEMTNNAVHNVWNYLRQIDPTTPNDPAAFVAEQVTRAERLSPESLEAAALSPLAA
jgi:hypothetical protein